MKFHWFAEASYPTLPDDFREKKISSWVDTPRHMADPATVGEMCRMFIRLMQQADREGFDGLAVNEHHQTPFAVTPSPNLLAPTLILHGNQDGLIPQTYAQTLATQIPNAQVQLIPNAGHYPMTEAEDAFIGAISAFLAN